MSQGDGRKCQQEKSDGVSRQGEMAYPDGPMTKKPARRGLGKG